MSDEEFEKWLKSETEEPSRQDARWAAFEQHKKTCERCQKSYEFWCDDGMRLKP